MGKSCNFLSELISDQINDRKLICDQMRGSTFLKMRRGVMLTLYGGLIVDTHSLTCARSLLINRQAMYVFGLSAI